MLDQRVPSSLRPADREKPHGELGTCDLGVAPHSGKDSHVGGLRSEGQLSYSTLNSWVDQTRGADDSKSRHAGPRDPRSLCRMPVPPSPARPRSHGPEPSGPSAGGRVLPSLCRPALAAPFTRSQDSWSLRASPATEARSQRKRGHVHQKARARHPSSTPATRPRTGASPEPPTVA